MKFTETFVCTTHSYMIKSNIFVHLNNKFISKCVYFIFRSHTILHGWMHMSMWSDSLFTLDTFFNFNHCLYDSWHLLLLEQCPSFFLGFMKMTLHVSSSDNKSVSHWIMFNYFFHVWKVNIFFFLIMFLIYSCSHAGVSKFFIIPVLLNF
jgi:hypothetical protein